MKLHWTTLILAAGVVAQNPPPPPSFEVAVIKPHNPADSGGGFSFQRGRLTISNTWLRILVMSAYRVKDFQISGGPNWIDSEKFDVLAEAPANSDPHDLTPMLKTLLTDRFKLAIHRETRQAPIYALAVTKNGPKFRRSSADTQYSMRVGPGGMSATKMSLGNLADTLSGYVSRIVIDKLEKPSKPLEPTTTRFRKATVLRQNVNLIPPNTSIGASGA